MNDYQRNSRRRNPTRYGNTGRFHSNPGGGGIPTWLLIGGAAAAGLYFFGPQLSSMFSGTSVPSGFTAVGGGLYRGPDGALYARNPQTGSMVKAPTGTTPTDAMDLLTRAGVQMLPGATTALADWVRGLFSTSATAAPSATTPRPGSTSPTSGSTSSGLTSGAMSALPALPGLISTGSGLLSGSGATELPALPAGDAWWDTIGIDAGQAWWDMPVSEPLPWDVSTGDWWDIPSSDLGWDVEGLAPLDDWSVDWGLDSMDWSVPDFSYDVPDFDYAFTDVPDFDFGFMGFGRRIRRRRAPSFLRRPASFR